MSKRNNTEIKGYKQVKLNKKEELIINSKKYKRLLFKYNYYINKDGVLLRKINNTLLAKILIILIIPISIIIEFFKQIKEVINYSKSDITYENSRCFRLSEYKNTYEYYNKKYDNTTDKENKCYFYDRRKLSEDKYKLLSDLIKDNFNEEI